KKLSSKKREQLFEIIIQNATYHIVSIPPATIDEKGLSWSLAFALKEIKEHIEASKYLFDGDKTFGVEEIETMIKADGKIPEVSAASILAKVTRDKSMIEAARCYPEYEFEKHKGYITKRHIELIKQYGYCDIHRRSYRVKALEATLF
ncbi:MAG: ribonuclease HII, partial [Epsilonproteobacteria bacterium]|nr:ribonuclease HII [Campylobacterota bacterium]